MAAVSKPPLPSFSISDEAQFTHQPSQLSLVPPSGHCHPHHRPPRLLRLIRNISRTIAIFTAPKCVLPSSSSATIVPSHTTLTCTLFGFRNGRVSFAIQENPRCLPSLVIDLAIQTHTLLLEMNTGAVRIAFECEKMIPKNVPKLLDEQLWTMFCNGKKRGYAARREGSEEDLMLMEMLKAVSTGAGVIPGKSNVEGPDGEMVYVRAGFQHVIGSRDSETMYMISPQGDNGPDLTIFFVRL